MIKVLRTDFFRAFRTKAFYIFPLFAVLMCVMELFFSASAVSTDGMTEKVLTVAIGADELLGDLYNGLLMMFLGLFLVIFCTDESKDGFLKNAAGTVSRRAVMPVSKIVIGIATIFIYALEYAVIRLLFFGFASLVRKAPLKVKALPSGEAGKFVLFMLLCVLVHIAIVIILVAMHEVTHNRALGIVFIFVYAVEMFDRLIIGFTNLLKSQFGLFTGVTFNKYLMMFNIVEGYKGTYYAPLRLFIICMIWAIAGCLVALIAAEKKDIR